MGKGSRERQNFNQKFNQRKGEHDTKLVSGRMFRMCKNKLGVGQVGERREVWLASKGTWSKIMYSILESV